VDFPSGKPLALLGYLAIEARPVDRDELGQLLWPTAPQGRSRHSVRQAIWLIRRTLGDEVLLGEDPVSISGEVLTCDILEFVGALEAGKVDHARSLWRGPLLSRLSLPDCRGWEYWREEKRSSLQRDLFRALLARARSSTGAGEGDAALEYLEEALDLNPFSVEAHLLRIETLIELNQIPGARNALEETERELGDQTGIGEELELLRKKVEHRESRAGEETPERMGESVEFVGRSGELTDLRGAWKRARTGYSGTACLLGPTGIGKTRLAVEFLTGVEEEGGRVAQAKGYRGEHRIPWGTVGDLARQLMALPGAKGISSGSEAVLRTVLPSLDRTGNGGEADNGGGEVNPAALSDAVADLVEAVGFEMPLVVFMDDWQWVDKESRALLGKVMRRLKGLACLILLAERTGERRRLQESAETLVGELGGRRIVLKPLTEGELGELLGLLAEFEDPNETTDLVTRVFRVTGGNPLFVGEVLRKLAEDGIYQQEEGRWVLQAGRLGDNLDLPESVQSLIRERLERLAPTAGQVAAALARERRNVPARTLRRRTGLDEAVFARAMGELVDREVITWVGAADVDFAHDQLREAAGLFFQAPRDSRFLSRVSKNPALAMTGTIGMAVVAILLVAGVSRNWQGLFGGDSVPPLTYPFGRGRVVLVGDSLLEVIPPAREGGEWTVSPSEIWNPAITGNQSDGPFLTPEGEIRWFGQELTPQDPPKAVEVHRSGSKSFLFESTGDQGFLDLAPSGDVGLLMTEEVAAPKYRQFLATISLDDGTTSVIYRSAEMLHGADWSPDGQRIAAVVSGSLDTLLVLTPTGTELARFVFPEYRVISRPNWCGDSRHLVFHASGFRPGLGVLLDTEAGSVREFGDELLAANIPVCLGDGRGAMFHGVTDAGLELYVQDFVTDSLTPLLDSPPTDTWPPRWLPDEVEAPVWRLEIVGGDREVRWGATQTLEALGYRTNGDKARISYIWESSDESVASVSEAGLVTGNRVGQAVIKATHAGWVKDSVEVTVLEALDTPGEMIFRETFQTPGLISWTIPDSTYPVPAVVERSGERVLSLMGDGRYRDFIETVEDHSLRQGGTLELEFRLLLNRDDRQRLAVCLRGSEATTSPEDSLPPTSGTGFCTLYPSSELAKRRGDLMMVGAGYRGLSYEVEVSPHLPSDDWVHLALQVRSDGTATVFVNRELVFQSESRLAGHATARWKIELAGAAVDTELLIRNLTLWRGERFEVTSTEPEPPPRR